MCFRFLNQSAETEAQRREGAPKAVVAGPELEPKYLGSQPKILLCRFPEETEA